MQSSIGDSPSVEDNEREELSSESEDESPEEKERVSAIANDDGSYVSLAHARLTADETYSIRLLSVHVGRTITS